MNMGNKSTNSLPNPSKMDLPDPESDLLAIPGPVFDFGILPLEIQEMILMKAAVDRRLSCETFREVYAVLALVCKHWLEMLNASKFYEKVERQTFLKDPVCRYLRTVQSIPITGLEDNVSRAVTLGNKLYVVADDGTVSVMERIFVYDMDYSAVRHEVREKRKVVCSNRRPLEVKGLINSVDYIDACPRTNTLYIIEDEDDDEEDEITKILKVNAEDGTVLGRWEFAGFANYLSLNLSGSYLIASCNTKIFVYDTSTFALVKTVALADARYWETGVHFTSAILLSDSLDSLAVSSTSKNDLRIYKYLVHDDYQCRLLLSNTPEPHCDLIDKRRADRSRKLCAEKSILADICVSSTWYDKVRGLLFCPLTTGGVNLRVIRITY